MRDLRGRTFILGIGAQKAGTSWLYNYLRSRPEVYMSPLKELHYFDRLYRPDLCSGLGHRFSIRLSRKLARMTGDEQLSDRPDIVALLDRIRMEYDRGAYLEFFSARVPKSATLLGEITPSYSLIGEDGFREIRELIEGRGLLLKIIFLMRDPAERYYSALRKFGRDNESFPDERAFIKFLANPQFYERTLYQVTLKNLRGIFSPADVYIGFYEHLFSHAEVERLCRFLDIDYSVAPDFATRVNQSPAGTMTDEMRAVARERFADVYEFCKAEFGDALPAAWDFR